MGEDGALQVVDNTRVCAPACQGMPPEQAMLEFDADELISKCADSLPEKIGQLKNQASLLDSLEKSWTGCRSEEGGETGGETNAGAPAVPVTPEPGGIKIQGDPIFS